MRFAPLFLVVTTLAAPAMPGAWAQKATAPTPATTAPPLRATVPPFVEGMDAVHPTDMVPVAHADRVQIFEAGFGGLPVFAEHFGGPSSGLVVNLATGSLSYLPPPDRKARNRVGTDAVFFRGYRSDAAKRGGSSPGLPLGWVHNYDVTVIVGEKNGAKELSLRFPSGVATPLPLDTKTPPNEGAMRLDVPRFFPFVAVGTPSDSVPGTWDSIQMGWKGGAAWVFRANASGSRYLLTSIDDLTLTYDAKDRLVSVAQGKTGLLSFVYGAENGLLKRVTDAFGSQVEYRYEAPPTAAGMGTAPCLMGVTIVHKTGEPAPAMLWQAYGYTPTGTDGKPYLSTVSVPNPSGDANYTTATIVYDAGIVSYLMDANENRRVYRYEPDGTRVTVSSKDGKVADTFFRHIDAQGRNRGKTDAAGNRSTLDYGDTKPAN